jgi:predicted O-methyltransferase YrrM
MMTLNATADVRSSLEFVAGIAGAYVCVKADLGRRRVKVNAALATAAVVGLAIAAFGLAAGLAGSEAFKPLVALVAGALGVLLVASASKVSRLTIADIGATALCLVLAIYCLALLLFNPAPQRLSAIAFALAVIVFVSLWQEGRAAMQWQRPEGIVCAEFLVLAGLAEIVYGFTTSGPQRPSALLVIVGAIIALTGAVLLAIVLRRYFGTREEHRVVDHIADWGDSLQPEYTPATPECPHPERWKMYDTMTAEVEVLEFLTTLVTTLKPELIVETGTFSGISTLALARGMEKNGFGRIISCEFDPKVYAKAKERIDGSGLGKWIELRNQSSLEMKVEGTIDLLFSDSDEKIREQEVRTFLSQVNPNGLILMHDAGSHYGIVRKGALKMEQEGLISVVLVPTPRGLVIAQKGRARDVGGGAGQIA